jgi:hypothetical protein
MNCAGARDGLQAACSVLLDGGAGRSEYEFLCRSSEVGKPSNWQVLVVKIRIISKLVVGL